MHIRRFQPRAFSRNGISSVEIAARQKTAVMGRVAHCLVSSEWLAVEAIDRLRDLCCIRFAQRALHFKCNYSFSSVSRLSATIRDESNVSSIISPAYTILCHNANTSSEDCISIFEYRNYCCLGCVKPLVSKLRATAPAPAHARPGDATRYVE